MKLPAYHRAHSACPACGSTRAVVDGPNRIIPDMKGSYVDRTLARCCDCQWMGIVHDMKPPAPKLETPC